MGRPAAIPSLTPVPAPLRRSSLETIEIIAYLLLVALLLIFRADLESLDLKDACQFTSLIAILCSISVVRNAPRGLWSPSSVFFLVLVLFHCGLVVPWALGRNPGEAIRDPMELWFFRSSTVSALWLVDLAFVSFFLGSRLGSLGRIRIGRPGPADAELDGIIGVVGAVLLIGSIAMWFALAIQSGGVGLLFGSYDRFLDATFGSTIPHIYRTTDYGAVLLAASPPRRAHRVSVAVYVIWALIALPLGIRGEVMFPVVTALAVIAYRRIPIRAVRTAVIAVAVLAAMAVVRNVRAVGIARVSEAQVSFDPLDGMAEMGTSLRPVEEVVFWHDMGDAFDNGATYWAPIDRSLYYVIPGWTRLPAEEDQRILSNVVMDRAGPIGFSMIAEAYRNFAAVGVALVLGLVGWLLARISRWPDTRVAQCIAGVVLAAMLAHVRNVFTPVPLQLALGFALIAAIVVVARARSERQRRTVSR